MGVMRVEEVIQGDPVEGGDTPGSCRTPALGKGGGEGCEGGGLGAFPEGGSCQWLPGDRRVELDADQKSSQSHLDVRWAEARWRG